jgi:hypothetical protein
VKASSVQGYATAHFRVPVAVMAFRRCATARFRGPVAVKKVARRYVTASVLAQVEDPAGETRSGVEPILWVLDVAFHDVPSEDVTAALLVFVPVQHVMADQHRDSALNFRADGY